MGGTGPSTGTGISGATLTLSGAQSAVAISASDGGYSFIVNAGGAYTVTAALPRYTLSAPITISNISANQPNTNFAVLLTSGGTLLPKSPSKEYIFMNGAVVAVEHPH